MRLKAPKPSSAIVAGSGTITAPTTADEVNAAVAVNPPARPAAPDNFFLLAKPKENCSSESILVISEP